MSTKLRHIPIFSGNTILGDGAVVLIVDPNGVASLVGATTSADAPEQNPTSGPSPVGERTTMLVFRAGADSLKAVPLSLVTRLEEVEAERFEISGGRVLLNYRGRLMPIIPVGETQVKSKGLQALVIIAEGELTMGLAVDAIVDIVDEVLDVELQAMLDQGAVGSAIIRGRATEILDLAHYLPKGDPNWLRASRREGVSSSAHVLMVEPSEFLREMLAPVLKAAGLRVTLAADIASARQHVAAGGLNGVLIDLDRYTEAALGFAAELRDGEDGDAFRILGMTTFATPELYALATQARMDAIVAKFDRRALLAELANNRSRLRQAA